MQVKFSTRPPRPAAPGSRRRQAPWTGPPGRNGCVLHVRAARTLECAHQARPSARMNVSPARQVSMQLDAQEAWRPGSQTARQPGWPVQPGGQVGGHSQAVRQPGNWQAGLPSRPCARSGGSWRHQQPRRRRPQREVCCLPGTPSDSSSQVATHERIRDCVGHSRIISVPNRRTSPGEWPKRMASLSTCNLTCIRRVACAMRHRCAATVHQSTETLWEGQARAASPPARQPAGWLAGSRQTG